jgi:hypothetical protein
MQHDPFTTCAASSMVRGADTFMMPFSSDASVAELVDRLISFHRDIRNLRIVSKQKSTNDEFQKVGARLLALWKGSYWARFLWTLSSP